MATGLGKCFGAGTPILMYDGSIRPVESIRDGDLVMGHDSAPRRVVGTTRGWGQLFMVSPVKGDPYVVNADHILSLKITGIGSKRRKRVTDSRGNVYEGGDICNISVMDYIACSKTFRHVAKGWRCGVEFPRRPVSIPPYILGLWLGDGHSMGTQITTMDAETLAAFEEYCEANDMRIAPLGYQNGGKALTYSIAGLSNAWGCNRFRTALKALGLLGDKHIPIEHLINGRQERLDLLAGLLDADGYVVDGNVFEIATSRKVMNDAILFLARSLGFAAYSREKTVKGKAYHRINISGDTHLIPTRIPRRKATERMQKKSVLVTGIDVSPMGYGEYFGFELEGADRLFLLGDFTVVHNTVTFSHIPRRGRMLILSHREELVRQPARYFDCPVGFERAEERSNGEEVVSASVQTLVRRLDRFDPDAFDVLITDEAHHAAARTYRKIYAHFRPRLHLGFTATPNRNDGVGLEEIFEDIIFERDIRWGIENGYLSPIYCLRADIGFDLSHVATRLGDYAPGELAAAVDIEGANRAVADTFAKWGEPPALIFCASVDHARNLAALIPGAVAVKGGEDRTETVAAFARGEIPAITNCMVFTEGTDLPNVRTVIIARPTKNASLYAQMVGRGTRLSEGKERLTLIDCVGISDDASLCTAPSLLGLDVGAIPKADRMTLEGDLFDLPAIFARRMDEPRAWIKNMTYVDLWSRARRYQLHGVNWFRTADGRMILSSPRVELPPEDHLGRIRWNGSLVPAQKVFDEIYRLLRERCGKDRKLWDVKEIKRWGAEEATEKQKAIVRDRCPGFDTDGLTKMEAGQILTRCFSR
ncbi:MAG: DEAD/DEAH box helicase family protein [Synergistaceae bacterium]|nr:DEAD/DEAH box helicase family protein [Synergistaceae bacterium]